jgi:hypothetical protein
LICFQIMPKTKTRCRKTFMAIACFASVLLFGSATRGSFDGQPVSSVTISTPIAAGGQQQEDLGPTSQQNQLSSGGQEERESSVVLTWRREGGIAGFCDEMSVSANGEVRARSCKPGGGSRTGMLSKEDLVRLDQWRMSFDSVGIETRDSPVTDAMTVTLTLKGNGTGKPTDEERQDILGWAQDVYDQILP